MLSKILTTLLLVYRNGVGLVLKPYRTMRSIATSADISHAFTILTFTCIYLTLNPTPTVLATTTLFFTFVFILSLGRKLRFDHWDFSTVLTVMTYTLIPTMLWFFVSFGLNAVLPPPRTSSVFGKSLSLLYIAFSISILFWKVILSFLAIRFAGKHSFYVSLGVLGLYATTILFMLYGSLHAGWLSVPFI